MVPETLIDVKDPSGSSGRNRKHTHRRKTSLFLAESKMIMKYFTSHTKTILRRDNGRTVHGVCGRRVFVIARPGRPRPLCVHTVLDGLTDGRTPGKVRSGIRR